MRKLALLGFDVRTVEQKREEKRQKEAYRKLVTMIKLRDLFDRTSAVLTVILLVTANSMIAQVPPKSGQQPAITPHTKRDLRLNGGFIQYWNDMMEWEWQDAGAPSKMPYPVDWASLVTSMRDIGMSKIVIQQLEYKQLNNEDATPLYKMSDTVPAKPRDDDTTEKILSAADRDMTVFMGLVDAEGWGPIMFDGPADKLESYLLNEKTGLANKNIAAADRIWTLYHRHESFKAWYIPLEIWNFKFPDGDLEIRKKKIDLMRRFWIKIADHLAVLDRRDNQKRKVAVAPYFNPDLAGPKDTEELFAELLKDSGVEIVMLQDGVGARANSDWQTVRSYYEAFGNACKKAKVALWADTEIYQANSRPVDIERLKQQLAVESEYTDTAIAWDFYQYMNPIVNDCCRDEQDRQVKCKNPIDASFVCVSKNKVKIINTWARDRRTLYDAYKTLIAGDLPKVLKQRKH